MFIEIDFSSDEALYMQLRNQIIHGIATEQFREGDSLPSVRAMAEIVGINMHTVNKAYAVLKDEGYIKVDRRHGAIIAVDIDALRALKDMRAELTPIIAMGMARGISREEMHELVDDVWGCIETVY